jgi:hypothetical protein
MISLELIVDRSNDIEFNELLFKTENFFNLTFHKVSPSFANAVNDEKQFMVSASPSNINFFLPDKTDLSNFFEYISKYIYNNFQNKTIGVKCAEAEEHIKSLNITNVRTLTIR